MRNILTDVCFLVWFLHVEITTPLLHKVVEYGTIIASNGFTHASKLLFGGGKGNALRFQPTPPPENGADSLYFLRLSSLSLCNSFHQAYGRMFIGKILHKHLLARNYFSRLPGMAQHMKQKISGKTRGLAVNNGARAAALKA